MYKIFGSSESFPGDIDTMAPISFDKYDGYKYEASFGEGKNTLKIVCVSDTHSKQDELKIPKCDLFIAAGDLINNKEGEREIKLFNKWLEKIESKNKIIIAGNQDNYLNKHKSKINEIFPKAYYLEYNAFQLKDSNSNILIYGAPCILRRNFFISGNAFALSGEDMKRQFEKIPSNTDILVTHVPPYGVLDISYKNKHLGSKWLRNEICNRIHPKIHIFGHNHDSPNSFAIGKFKNGETCLFVNACVYYTEEPCIINYKY